MAKYRIKTCLNSHGQEQYIVQRKVLGLIWVTCMVPIGYTDTEAIFCTERDAKEFISKRRKADSYQHRIIKVN